jgi:cytochrome b
MIGISGYMMTTLAFFGIAWVEELHELFVNWAVFSVVLHVGGVVFESRRLNENLVRAMVTGNKWRKRKQGTGQ